MKELSIEDKAKRYDEAIEELRGLLEGIHEDKCNIMEEDIIKIFPELKESEDERIREWLINLVKSHTEWLEDRIKEQLSNGQIYGGELNKAKDAIAWLEKQCEKPIKIGSKNAVGKLGELMEKHGEQKPTENKDYSAPLNIEIPFGAKDSELQEVTYYIPKGFHAEIDDNEVVIKKGEKPTKWSEEDEKMCQETIDWFKKKCFPYALESENPAIESIKWLKSIKDRYTWKPSERQLQSLEMATKYYMSGKISKDYTGKDLSEILNELKKLKG